MDKPITKDTLILVAYLNIKGIEPSEVPQYVSAMGNNLNPHVKGSDMKVYIVPFMGNEPMAGNRIECINPKMISHEEFEKVKQKTELFEQAMDAFIQAAKIAKEKKG